MYEVYSVFIFRGESNNSKFEISIKPNFERSVWVRWMKGKLNLSEPSEPYKNFAFKLIEK